MKYLVSLLLLVTGSYCFAQVGIGTTTPSSAAMLEISGQTSSGEFKGFMPPRVPDVAAQLSINPTAADAGLMVFVESSECLDLWNGSSWQNIYCLGGTPDVWINEFHYQNVGDDEEFIELAGVAGTDLRGYYIALYNGGNGTSYGAIVEFLDIIDDEGNGYGAISVSVNNMQVGTEGMALFGPNNEIIQFLSYEGTFTATSGPAIGQSSTDVGVQEATTTAIDQSLHLTGTGNQYSDFTWQVSASGDATPGSLNLGQTIN